MSELAADDGVLTLASLGTAAATGAGMALVAWAHRRLEGLGKSASGE